MELSNVILFVLAAVGMTAIVVDSEIMQPVRDLLEKILPEKVFKLFGCYQCTGFWSGVINGFILLTCNPIVLVCCGCAGSAASSFWAYYINYLEAQSLIELSDELDKDE